MAVTMPVFSDPTYRVETELGSGGGGVVYKAWHTRLKKHVVIKELKSSANQDVETQRNEVEALKNVKSRYLPQVFDFLTDGDRVFTVMEFIEGDSLDKLLERGQRFSQPEVIKWYGQLVSALEAIHEKHVCHRDIKPANIMLTPGGDVCLIDFNAALVSGNDVRLISRSLGYASPEQYEIYERFKSGHGHSLVNLGNSGLKLASQSGEKTEFVDDALNHYNGSDDLDADKTEFISPPPATGIDWKRSDVYSLGATMYHLLSGQYPHQRAAQVVPVSRLGRFSEGIVYAIEQSMRLNPIERFSSANTLAAVIKDIEKHDSRWRRSQSKKLVASIILPVAFIAFAALAVFGRGVMNNEKEALYFDTISSIASGAEPDKAYADALKIHWDRIEPYRAMSERLWNDGDLAACRTYIEQNLGNIAKFQGMAEAERAYGDIYFILGNCYYQLATPDYQQAKSNFEIAVQYVIDNPVYYRDYAISLARVGEIGRAEDVLSKAETLGLDADSLNLLSGEIGFAKHNYEQAIYHFEQVISKASNDYERYRAYHTSDEIYKLLGRPDLSVDLLSNALVRIPQNRVPEMTERLADAYVRTGDYDQAITAFEKLAEHGPPQFHIMQGLAILLQDQDELDRAARILDDMADLFPNEYRVKMRQAFLEADRQSRLANESRDYSQTKEYFETAQRLYEAQLKPGESDPEMQQLNALMVTLHTNGWFE